jgi:hypothetical protein
MKSKSLVLIIGVAMMVGVGLTANAAPIAKESLALNEIVIDKAFSQELIVLAVNPYNYTSEVSFIESIELNFRPAFFWKPFFVIQGTCLASPAVDLPDVRCSTSDTFMLTNHYVITCTLLHIDPGLCS